MSFSLPPPPVIPGVKYDGMPLFGAKKEEKK